MSIVTLTRGGRVIDASPQAAAALRRQGWVEVADGGPVAVVAPRPIAISTGKPRAKKVKQ